MILRAFAITLPLLLAFSGAEAADEAAQGERVYRDFCQKCHGVYGRGDGPALEYLTVRPPDLTDPGVLRNRSTDEIVSAPPRGREGLAKSALANGFHLGGGREELPRV
jgi:hypothetical protein